MASRFLVLEDGTVYEGDAFGADAGAYGEVVFSTAAGGYQESLTDPSFRGQILVLAFPMVGNYGTTDGFVQSGGVQVRAVAVHECCKEPSPMYGGRTIDEYLRDNGVPGISGIDTRDLVIRIRTAGTMKACLTDEGDAAPGLVANMGSMPVPSEGNLVAEVSTGQVRRYEEGRERTVGLLDFGTKASILRDLRARFNVTVFPWDTPAGEIASSGVEGVLLSNGPGDPGQPEMVAGPVQAVKGLVGKMPIYGICLGNQILALAFGGRVYKMKFGHHGANQPVLFGGRVYITSQNHGFAVDPGSLEGTGMAADQFNVSDRTVEGMRHESLPIFSTQYHPEAFPGPTDTTFLFDRFGDMIERGAGRRGRITGSSWSSARGP